MGVSYRLVAVGVAAVLGLAGGLLVYPRFGPAASAGKAEREASGYRGLAQVVLAELRLRKERPGEPFTRDLSVLREKAGLDAAVASGARDGYAFTITRADREGFEAHADPVTPGVSGERYFFANADGAFRMSTTGAATDRDPATSAPEAVEEAVRAVGR